MNKNIIKFIIIGFIIGLLTGFFGYYLTPKYWPNSREGLVQDIEVKKIYASYPADYRKDEVLMGAAHNVFVIKILEQVEIRDYDIPVTMFEGEIVQNIKGNLGGRVLIGQEGAYKNGVLYAMEYEGKPENYLLQLGKTYLLATRYSPGGNWHLLNSHPNARKIISSDKKLSKIELQSLSSGDVKVKALQEAYKNEILLEADIKHNNTRNSYESVYGKKE